MSDDAPGHPWQNTPFGRFLWRDDILAGLLFMAVAIIGLWVSRDYPVGTATRMSTGYVPRLLCWVLLGLGLLTAVQGARSPEQNRIDGTGSGRALIFIPIALIAFALLLDQAGLIVSSAILITVGALASRESRLKEVVVAAVGLVAFIWFIFVWTLGLSIQVWPDW